MMVTNFALIVLLLWAGSVPMVIPKHYGHMNRKFWGQSVCNKYTLPVNTMWTLRARCEDTKRFKCQPGYQSRVQTACRNGLWYTEPTCQAVTCPSGEIISNSDNVTTSGIFGEDFTFDCKAGYRSDNGITGTMTCDKWGNWIDKTICEEVSCPSGENITFSSDVTQFRKVGEEIDYGCLDGYKQNGTNGTLTCGTNGNWTVKRRCEVCYKITTNVELYGLNAFLPQYRDTTLAECAQLCNGNGNCSSFERWGKQGCTLALKPFILPGPIDCIKKCTELIECVIVYSNDICILLTVPKSQLLSIGIYIGSSVFGTMGEKICI